jgi:hypothetical protein
LLSPLLSNLLLGKLSRLTLQHLYLIVERELHLVSHGYEALRNVLIVLPQQVDREEEVVNVVEHNCVFVRILFLLREEGDGVLAPMAERVEVMGSMVAVVVAVAIALYQC